ncbi:hypothetical protein [Ruminiclostridium papyrosolvens]|uniref:hypothetical protein n=1 Tax=Ruminiclostridium papyrosolvens TaxID=29362 RepID=UPI0005933A3C|nr:hypothetical protein [Ruminiclostridium papyrosolvens]
MPISAVGKSDSMVTKSNTDYAILEKGLGLRRLKGSSDNKTKIFFSLLWVDSHCLLKILQGGCRKELKFWP